jgi:hypothetical protein
MHIVFSIINNTDIIYSVREYVYRLYANTVALYIRDLNVYMFMYICVSIYYMFYIIMHMHV